MTWARELLSLSSGIEPRYTPAMSTRLFTHASFFGPGLDPDEPPSEVLCRDGRVLALGHGLPRAEVDEIIDLRGHWAFPGMIDPHVHFDEPGYTQREDFAHGTASALQRCSQRRAVPAAPSRDQIP